MLSRKNLLVLGCVSVAVCTALFLWQGAFQAQAAEGKQIALTDSSQLLALLFNPYTLQVEKPQRVSTEIAGAAITPTSSTSGGDPFLKNYGPLYLKNGPSPRIPRRPSFRSPIRPGW